jgi:hypothetical protein
MWNRGMQWAEGMGHKWATGLGGAPGGVEAYKLGRLPSAPFSAQYMELLQSDVEDALKLRAAGVTLSGRLVQDFLDAPEWGEERMRAFVRSLSSPDLVHAAYYSSVACLKWIASAIAVQESQRTADPDEAITLIELEDLQRTFRTMAQFSETR